MHSADSFFEGEAGRHFLAVPGVWESSFEFFEYRGLGLYECHFILPESGDYRLIFGGVSHTATVRFDGMELGSHYGAHTSFEFLLEKVEPGSHRLQVLVDNRFGPQNPLTRARSDIYTYGGIVRSVNLEKLPNKARLDEVAVLPKREVEGWKVALSLSLTGCESGRYQLRCTLGDLEIARVSLEGGNWRGEIPIDAPELWSPETPYLHRFGIDLVERESAVTVDRFQSQIGFRTIECRGDRILLNGQSLVLAGVNRHEFHPDFGPALPLTIHLRDLEILRLLGANFVRVSHYPSDPAFLDLCDQYGILVWEELSHWQPTEEEMSNPAFVDASLVELEEMVNRDRHHPCVVVWGMLNEAETDSSVAVPVVEKLTRKFRELDGTRLVAYASNRASDLCFGFVDVAARNLYPGWYGGRLESIGAAVREQIELIRKLAGNKPVILSEFGAAAGTGVRSFEARKWTEDYQARLLVSIIDTASSLGVSGVCVWQFCDVRTSAEHGLDRYREYNNKGLVSEYRQPKLAFEAVRVAFARILARVGQHAGAE
ncbi:glycoside hydrolase family 2 protein [soil metagenome]